MLLCKELKKGPQMAAEQLKLKNKIQLRGFFLERITKKMNRHYVGEFPQNKKKQQFFFLLNKGSIASNVLLKKKKNSIFFMLSTTMCPIVNNPFLFFLNISASVNPFCMFFYHHFVNFFACWYRIFFNFYFYSVYDFL
jgi:hypothetical protein